MMHHQIDDVNGRPLISLCAQGMMALMSVPHNYELLSQLPQAQVERLAHIDFRLYFLGDLGRSDVTSRFGTGPAGATRDIALYREIAPSNVAFNGREKVYVPSDSFRPLFDHPVQRALTALSQGFGEGLAHDPVSLVRCEFPVPLGLPQVEVLAAVTRAIHRGRALKIKYSSNTSGTTEREIVPFALVDTGLRWHARAFDRKTNSFRDFVLTRMSDVVVLEQSEVLVHERADHDLQWSRVIELELVPHPAHERPEVVRLDYGMEKGNLLVRARAATVGYVLRRWNVDCSQDHHLHGPEYALWLSDPLALYGAETALLAPGYQNPRSEGAASVPT
jgi:hypothetical protein